MMTKKASNKRTCPATCSKADSEAPVRVRKLLRSAKEPTRCVHQKPDNDTQTMVRPKPKKQMATVVVAVPVSEKVPKKPNQVVKLAKEGPVCRRNPKRKCVLDDKGTERHVRSKTALKRQVEHPQVNLTNPVCDDNQDMNDTVKHEPSTSNSDAIIIAETYKITAKTKEVEKAVADLQEQLAKENAQIAKLGKLLAKRQTVHKLGHEKKSKVKQAESRKLTPQLDHKEVQIEERTTQLQRKLHDGERNNQKEMQKLKKQLVSDWQKKVNRTQSAISKMRHELRTKVVSWKNEKEALEQKFEKDRDALKKTGSRYRFFKVCEKQLKKRQTELERGKSEVLKSDKVDTEKATAVKQLEDELHELKMNLVSC